MVNKVKNFPHSEESYQIIGICMEVHKNLRSGLLEVVYKDAAEYEFKANNIPYEREKKYQVEYKGIILPHYFFADFVVFDKVLLEIKAQKRSIEEHYKWVINYLAISGCDLGLVVNFGDESLITKRLIFNPRS
jgi:GxxExxY protein